MFYMTDELDIRKQTLERTQTHVLTFQHPDCHLIYLNIVVVWYGYDIKSKDSSDDRKSSNIKLHMNINFICKKFNT